MYEAAQTAAGRLLLSEAFGTCEPLAPGEVEKMIMYGSFPWFNLAEGNYPFPSTYITFSVGPGLIPLPAWPMRVACAKGLNNNYGVKFTGNRSAVKYTVALGDMAVAVDWDQTSTPSGQPLVPDAWGAAGPGHGPASSNSTAQLAALVKAVADAVGVWFNITGNLACNDVRHHRNNELGRGLRTRTRPRRPPPPPLRAASAAPAPLATLPTCSGSATGGAWGAIGCNEHLDEVMCITRGAGRDFFWPPARIGEYGGLPKNWTYATEVARRYYSCRHGSGDPHGYPAARDAWSRWMDEYYGGLRIEAASNIVFTNGLLDPWSSGGVNENISSSLVSVALPLGAHHLDLMFSNAADPPCAREARSVQEANVRAWIKSSPSYNPRTYRNPPRDEM